MTPENRNAMTCLESADTYIQEHRNTVNPRFRQTFHLMGEIGWVNDPNGFTQHEGQYHLFYQHYPYDTVWGPMHWGHAVSDDLITWTYLPVALAPDQPYDRDGCFSGSALSVNDQLYLFYTGHVVLDPTADDYQQQQCLAVSSDGITFDKFAGNPILPLSSIPDGASRRDFRDPKVTPLGDRYGMVIGSNDGQGHGHALLYTSRNLTDWSFQNVVARSDGSVGTNWECPDLFELQGKGVLLISPQNVDPATYLNTNTVLYLLGTFDHEAGVLRGYQHGRVDYGFDFYAPQTLQDDQGRRIMVGWMNTWHQENPTHTLRHGWAGGMSLPREVVLVGDTLHFRPIAEIERYRVNPFELLDMTLSGRQRLDTEGIVFELAVDVDVSGADEFGLDVRVGATERTVLRYDVRRGMVVLDRNASGIGPKGEATAKLPLPDKRLSVRLFADTSSVEVFLNNGEMVMSALIYPDDQSRGIELWANGEARVQSIQKWDLRCHPPVRSDEKHV